MNPRVAAERRRAMRDSWRGWLPSGLCVVFGILLLTIAAVPVADSLITLAAVGSGLAAASEHLLGLVVLPLGVYVLRADRRRAAGHPVRGEGSGQR
jgi:hypothetical protein